MCSHSFLVLQKGLSFYTFVTQKKVFHISRSHVFRILILSCPFIAQNWCYLLVDLNLKAYTDEKYCLKRQRADFKHN